MKDSKSYVVHAYVNGVDTQIGTFGSEEGAKLCSDQYNKYITGEGDYVDYEVVNV